MENIQSDKEHMLWKEAKKRVGFRNHLLSYIAVNIFFWAMWFFTDRNNDEGGVPWPTFCSLGWGFGLFWHFLGTYVFDNKVSAVEKEFEKLKERSGL